MGWSVYTTTPATEAAIDVEMLRDHIGLIHLQDDELLQVIVETATIWVEQWTGRRLVTQNVTEVVDGWPISSYYPLHVYPVSAVVIKYDDDADTEQTLDAGDYWTHFNRLPPMVEVKDSWPGVYDKLGTVRYELSVGEAQTDIPKPIIQALKIMGAHLYANRELLSEIALHEVPMSAKTLLRNYRIWLG